ncbi:MAG: hypothetical protein D6734_03700, partial [Candidatus Schekmanbacteria bacterium]
LKGLIVIDKENAIIDYNDAFLNLTGLERKKIEKYTIDELLKIITNSDIDLDRISKKGQLKIDINKKDKRITAFLYSLPLYDKNASYAGKVLVIEPYHFKKREKIIHNERTNKLRAMGEIAGAMAHEIRNPLGSIELFASMIKSDLISPDELEQFSDHILTAVKKLECVISNLMIFSNPPKPSFNKVDINSALNDFLDSIKHLLEHNNVVLIKNFPGMTHYITLDIELAKQALLNLILNAIQAMQEGGILEVNAKLEDNLKDYPSGAYVITISDTGCGIPPENLEKIFLPFFSTKIKKAGIGLSIVNNIVEAHRGHIEVQSIVGEGTTFKVFFPLTMEEAMK